MKVFFLFWKHLYRLILNVNNLCILEKTCSLRKGEKLRSVVKLENVLLDA